MLGNLDEILRRPAAERPAVLEGRWLGQNDFDAVVASSPAGVLEGGAEALGELPAWLAWHAERFPAGAAIGYLAYELASGFESLRLRRFEALPDFSFAYYPRLEKTRRAPYCWPSSPSSGPSAVRANFDEKSFVRAVDRIRECLTAGDIYQANLTQQFSVSVADRSPEEIYYGLSYAPFRAFLNAPARVIVSNSPERFFRVSGRHILASPVKGTIARSTDTADDERATARLLASAKDRAENVMIVDLVRNDLGKVCRYESIGAHLFEIDALPHLFHLVSHVRGRLRPEVGLFEIVRALFPCGSITGAPKLRAMEILAEIENAPRGVSMGAVGIILGDPYSDRCKMDFNVAIRTLTLEGGVATFNVGGGIVADSNAESEYNEMMLKAQPLLEALGVANIRPAPAAEVVNR